MDVDPTETASAEERTDHQESTERGGRSSALSSVLGLLLPGFGRPSGPGSAAAVHWLVPGSLLIGLFYVGLWLADVSFLGLLMVLGAARTVDRWGGEDKDLAAGSGRLGLAGTIALFVLLIFKLALWTAIPVGVAGWPGDWRRFFNFAYPRPVFRPLLLAPMWGRRGMILAASIGRTAPAEGGPIPGLLGARSPAVVVGWFLPVLGLTAVYCGRGGRWTIGCMIGLAVLGVTFLFAVIAARRFSGHTRFSVYAAALISELAFLIFYLAASQRIYY